MSLRAVGGLFKDTYEEWTAQSAPRLGAALAYYTIFSLAPLLLIMIAIVGLAFGADAARGEIVDRLQSVVGGDAARLIQQMIDSTHNTGGGVLATIVGTVTLLLGATGLVAELKSSLDVIWHVPPAEKAGIRGIVRSRLLSLLLVLIVGVLVLVSLAASTTLMAFSRLLGERLGVPEIVFQAIDIVFTIVFITLATAAVLKVLPTAHVRWREALPGALVTAVLFAVGKFLISLYLAHSSVGSTYGAAGSAVVLLLWVYYSAQILFFGAAFARTFAQRHERAQKPASRVTAAGRPATT